MQIFEFSEDELHYQFQRKTAMVDEFMVCVDRILVSAACFQESTSSVEDNGGAKCTGSVDCNVDAGLTSLNGGVSKKGVTDEIDDKGISISSMKLKNECRICQEEDDDTDMEAPCACNGTLKFAHRKCIQKWCSKKGDITCEICNQVFSPNYIIPRPRNDTDVMAIDIRQAWGPHVDLRDPRLLALAAAEQQFLESEYENYAIANNGTITYLRAVAVILMLILLVRQTLMITRDSRILQDSSTIFHYQLSVLQLAGFLLPCYVVARSWYIVHCRRRRQG